MPILKDLEIGFRVKYNFPDDDTTIKTLSESILIAGLMRILSEDEVDCLAYEILTKIICVRPRLQNLVAMLWRACKIEHSDNISIAKEAITRGILQCQDENEDENMKKIILEEVVMILPPITDIELLKIQQEQKKTHQILHSFNEELRRHLEMGRSIFEEFCEDDSPASTKDFKKVKLGF